jgi:uncharacterized membrane protein YbhN (UPF0104 family)
MAQHKSPPANIRRDRYEDSVADRLRDDLPGGALGQQVIDDPGVEIDIEGKTQARRKAIHRIGVAFSLAIFAFALYVLSQTLATVNLSDLRASVAATSAEQITGAALLTGLSYLALTGYDALALRQIGARVRYRTTALASFTSYAISFTLGFPLITAGAVRYWVYSQAGLSAGRVASLTIVAGVTFWLGMALVVGTGLVLRAETLADVNQLKVSINLLIGAGILGAIGAYLVWVGVRRRRVRVQGFRLRLPGAGVTLAQMALGVIDLCAAAGALYVLLPPHATPDFVTFAATYVFGALLGIISHAPGGIGVFEATMLKALVAPNHATLLAALLLFRVIYYLAPFVLALALLGANEAMRRWQGLREAIDRSRGEE